MYTSNSNTGKINRNINTTTTNNNNKEHPYLNKLLVGVGVAALYSKFL